MSDKPQSSFTTPTAIVVEVSDSGKRNSDAIRMVSTLGMVDGVGKEVVDESPAITTKAVEYVLEPSMQEIKVSFGSLA